MTARIKEKQLKGFIVLILFIILTFQVMIGRAQSFRNSQQNLYKGFVVSFGTRSVAVSSDISKINGTNLMETGGQVGVTFGNEMLRTRIGILGYYSSAGSTAGTTDLYESNASANFYPFALFNGNKCLVQPYLTAGISYDRFKFFGYYINREPGVTNYSQSEAPFLGKIKQVNGTVGMGLELKLRDQFDFINVFSEVKYGYNLSQNASDNAFNNTTLMNQMQVVLGVSFGLVR